MTDIPFEWDSTVNIKVADFTDVANDVCNMLVCNTSNYHSLPCDELPACRFLAILLNSTEYEIYHAHKC